MKQITCCTRCIMNDSSDETIIFDSSGICNYCKTASSYIGRIYFPRGQTVRKLGLT